MEDKTKVILAGMVLTAGGHTYLGTIGYSTPGGKPGIYLGNDSCINQSSIFPGGCSLSVIKRTASNNIQISSDNSTSSAGGIIIDTDDNVTIIGLAGAGNVYACLDSAGKLYRSATACS